MRRRKKMKGEIFLTFNDYFTKVFLEKISIKLKGEDKKLMAGIQSI